MSVKLVLYLFGFVFFIGSGIQHVLFADPDNYIAEIRKEAKLITFTIDRVKCRSKNRTSDELELIAKENGAMLIAYIGGSFNCASALNKFKVGDLVKSHVNLKTNDNRLMSLNVNGEQISSLEKFLEEKKYNFGNFSAIHFVMAIVFIMLFINERREQNGKQQ